MSFSTVRQFLSYAAENFSAQIFETVNFSEYVYRALDESGKWHRRECPLKAPFMMRFVFALILYRSLSIANVLKKLLQQFRSEFHSLSLKAITPEATCHARARLGVEPLRIFFEAQAAEIMSALLFHGLSVWGVDGSSFNIPDTPANEARFGRPESSAYPQVEVVSLMETSVRQVKAVIFTPCDSSEHNSAFKLLDHLGANDLLLTDRGISATWLFAQYQKRSCHFLGRISSNWKPHVVDNIGPGDFIVNVKGNIPRELRINGKSSVKMKMRMIEYRIGGSEAIRLLTDLSDPREYPAMELARLYHSRWGCETAYDELKNHLASRVSGGQTLLFRSKTPDGVIQEAYALYALYNMIRGLMVKAGKVYDINPLDISFVDTVQLIKDATLHFHLAATDRERSSIYDQLLKDIAESPIRRRLFTRQYPRVVKRRASKYNARGKDYRQRLFKIEEEMKFAECLLTG